MTTSKTFTPAALDNLKTGKLGDPQTPGLAVIVSEVGTKLWRYRRRVTGSGTILKLSFGAYPARTIAQARQWAREINDKIEIGVDPRELEREERSRAAMTIVRAHGLYMVAVNEGRASRSTRKNSPRTIKDKLKIFRTDIEPTLGRLVVYEVTEDHLVNLVIAKGKSAKVRANRLASELKVFFGWASSLRGREVGLKDDPSRRLSELRFAETPRQRKLSLIEIEWLLIALAREEERDFRRGLLLWLLTATRFSELVGARSDEVINGVWTIPAERSKNHQAHSIALGPWGRKLIQTNGEWIFPAPLAEGPRRVSQCVALVVTDRGAAKPEISPPLKQRPRLPAPRSKIVLAPA